MVKKKYPAPKLTLILSGLLVIGTAHPDAHVSAKAPDAKEQTKSKRSKKKKKNKKKIDFSFTNKPLSDLVNMMAAHKSVNVIMPQPHTLKQADGKPITVTYQQEEKMTVDDAWDRLLTIIDLAGYTMIEESDVYIIRLNDDKANREPLPVYIRVKAEDLPHTAERIRYVTYLRNIRVPKDAGGALLNILKDMLSTNADIKFDTTTNGVILTDKSDNIAAAMTIIEELDRSGYPESIEVIPLFYTQATVVKKLFADQILKSENQPARPAARQQQANKESATYFSHGTKIVSETRTNSLIIMGKSQAINRIKHFIHDYIDVPPGTGESLLHTYELQHLDAQQFAEVLKQVVAGTDVGQSTGKAVGPDRYFEGVKIQAEAIETAREGTQIEGEIAVEISPTASGKAYQGGNRIVVAARKHDWLRIKKIIEEMDRPEPQVILEAMLVDLRLEGARDLGTLLRNKCGLELPDGVDFQSIQLGPTVGTNEAVVYTRDAEGSPPTSITPDFIAGVDPNNINPIANAADNATLISFNDRDDKGVWSLVQILEQLDTAKVLSHPYLVTSNNVKASTELSEIQRLAGESEANESGVVVRKDEDVKATVSISVTPRISSLERLNLQFSITIERFLENANNNARESRKISTNANLNSGEILVIGGLTRVQDDEGQNATPLLSKIPIFGWLFKRNTARHTKNDLLVFITPTIIQPKCRRAYDHLTLDKIHASHEKIEEELVFGEFRDPITRWFFKHDRTPHKMMDDYFNHSGWRYAESAMTVPTRDSRQNETKLLSRGRPCSDNNKQEPIVHKDPTKYIEPRGQADQLKQLIAQEENPLTHSTK